MARANAAFYAGPDPLSHFTTAPEISQAFGECLGLWAAVTWQQIGSPDPVWLVELGPGRGTLMTDAWRAIGEMVPGFAAAARIALVEASASLRARQSETGLPATWFGAMAEVPPGPAIIIGNEFLDALPIRQFIRREGGWMERWVADGGFVERPVAPSGHVQDPPSRPADLPPDAPIGSVTETAEPAWALAATLGARLARQGGAALFLDYGPAANGMATLCKRYATRRRPTRSPCQARPTFPRMSICRPGARRAPAVVHGPLPMGLFLQRLGLVSRAAMLARAAPDQAGLILSGAQRLVAAEGMGSLFKVLCLGQPGRPVPAGFE